LLQYSKHVGNPWSLCEFPGFRTAGPEGESHKLCRRPGSWLRKSTYFGGVSGHGGESRTDCGNVQPALTKGRHPSRVVLSILPNLRSQLQSRPRYELQRQCINCRSGKGGYFVLRCDDGCGSESRWLSRGSHISSRRSGKPDYLTGGNASGRRCE